MTQNTINAGVILFNIKKLREDNKDFEHLHFLFKKKFTEQTLIGYVSIPKIGYLPFKYDIFFIGSIKTYASHIENNMVQRVNLTEVSEAMKDPTIVHDLFYSSNHWIKKQLQLLKKNIGVKNINIFFIFMQTRQNTMNIYIINI